MSAEKIIQSIKDHSITNSDEWFANLEDRKKEEVLLHDKLRDMNFRKKNIKRRFQKILFQYKDARWPRRL